jgi:hypothetical protein
VVGYSLAGRGQRDKTEVGPPPRLIFLIRIARNVAVWNADTSDIFGPSEHLDGSITVKNTATDAKLLHPETYWLHDEDGRDPRYRSIHRGCMTRMAETKI